MKVTALILSFFCQNHENFSPFATTLIVKDVSLECHRNHKWQRERERGEREVDDNTTKYKKEENFICLMVHDVYELNFFLLFVCFIYWIFFHRCFMLFICCTHTSCCLNIWCFIHKRVHLNFNFNLFRWTFGSILKK